MKKHTTTVLLVVAVLITLLSVGQGTGLSNRQKKGITDKLNGMRKGHQAANMRKLGWNNNLADFAFGLVKQCAFIPLFTHMTFGNFKDVGVNMGYKSMENSTSSTDEDMDSLLDDWFTESNDCDDWGNCGHFTQLIWAKTFFLGCAVFICPTLVLPGPKFVHALLFTCLFAPGGKLGFDPWKPGPPCSDCPKNTVCDKESWLCTMDDTMMMGADPHFSVKLPDGNLLCYTVQGEHFTYFDIFSNSQLQMNAKFVPGGPQSKKNNTWLGEIGMTLLTPDDRIIQFKFDASKNQFNVGNTVHLAASAVQKITITKGKLMLVSKMDQVDNATSTSVFVDLRDLDIQFSIKFIKNQHLDLFWHSVGQGGVDTHGLIGQFLRVGVELDKESQKLIIPGRDSVAMIQRPVWGFMESGITDHDKICWTTELPSNQGKGLIEGNYKDYIVDDLLYSKLQPSGDHVSFTPDSQDYDTSIM